MGCIVTDTLPAEIVALSEHQKKRATGFLLTDGGNAERFAAEHGHEVRYCYPWGKWLVWDERRWRVDDTGAVQRLAKKTTRRMLREAADDPDDDRRRARGRWANASDSRPRRDAMLALAQSEPGIPVLPEQLDQDGWLLNVENGTLNLRTGELQPHGREDLITKLAPVTHDATATAPRWQRFLEEVLPDPALRRFVQAATGYSGTGDTSEQVLFFLHGLGGNGKSKFLEAVQHVLGDYATQVMPDLLMAHQGERHPTELTDLYGRRFVATIEAEEGRRFAESYVKWLTGGDAIRGRRMREDFWQWRPTHKLFLAANYRPVIRGTDVAIWRRIRLVPFTVTIPEEQRDAHLADKLAAEAPGILCWLVEGCLAWQRDGLRPPAAVRAATTDYQAEMDVVGRFVGERCRVDSFAQVSAAMLYKAFRAWCQDTGERDLSQQSFGRRLSDRGFERVRRKSGHWWTGLGLLSGDPLGDPGDPFEPDLGLTGNLNFSRSQSEKASISVTTVTRERDREPGDDDEEVPEATT